MRGNDPSAYSRAKYQRTKEGAQKASPTNASTYQAARYLGNNNYAPKQKADFFTRGSLIAVAVVVVLAIVGIFAFNNWMGSKPVEVTLNGDPGNHFGRRAQRWRPSGQQRGFGNAWQLRSRRWQHHPSR